MLSTRMALTEFRTPKRKIKITGVVCLLVLRHILQDTDIKRCILVKANVLVSHYGIVALFLTIYVSSIYHEQQVYLLADSVCLHVRMACMSLKLLGSCVPSLLDSFCQCWCVGNVIISHICNHSSCRKMTGSNSE